MEIKDIVLKLVGRVNPVGETTADNQSFENLKVLCDLVNDLVGVIDDVHYKNKDFQQMSIKRSSEYARNFLTDTLGIEYEEL